MASPTWSLIYDSGRGNQILHGCHWVELQDASLALRVTWSLFLWLKGYHTQVLLVCVFVLETKAERKRDKAVSQYVLKNYVRWKKLLQKQTSLYLHHQIYANAFCKNMKKYPPQRTACVYHAVLLGWFRGRQNQSQDKVFGLHQSRLIKSSLLIPFKSCALYTTRGCNGWGEPKPVAWK